MEFKAVYTFFFLLFVFLNFSSGKLHAKTRIVSGRTADSGQFPYYVAIKYNTYRSLQGGGSLISSDWVLTAAHVVSDVEYVIVIFGVTKLSDKNSLNMTSYNMYAHPGYETGVMTYDIALIKLPDAVIFNENIKPISLPAFSMANETFVGSKIAAVGFGYTGDYYLRELPDELQFTLLTVIGQTQCEEELKREISDVLFCAKAKYGGATCNGDSGGPAVKPNEKGDFIQIGIISFGYDQRCEVPLPIGLTRITKYLNWINEVTGLVKP